MSNCFVSSSHVKYFCYKIECQIFLLKVHMSNIFWVIWPDFLPILGLFDENCILKLCLRPTKLWANKKLANFSVQWWNRGVCRTNAPQMAAASFPGPAIVDFLVRIPQRAGELLRTQMGIAPLRAPYKAFLPYSSTTVGPFPWDHLLWASL